MLLLHGYRFPLTKPLVTQKSVSNDYNRVVNCEGLAIRRLYRCSKRKSSSSHVATTVIRKPLLVSLWTQTKGVHEHKWQWSFSQKCSSFAPTTSSSEWKRAELCANRGGQLGASTVSEIRRMREAKNRTWTLSTPRLFQTLIYVQYQMCS